MGQTRKGEWGDFPTCTTWRVSGTSISHESHCGIISGSIIEEGGGGDGAGGVRVRSGVVICRESGGGGGL